jgi:hypothetical protein
VATDHDPRVGVAGVGGEGRLDRGGGELEHARSWGVGRRGRGPSLRAVRALRGLSLGGFGSQM